MSSPPSSEAPPYYVLVSQAAPPAGSQSVGGVYKSFSHPIIQYHYADDHPHALLPQSPNEHVLVLDYDHSDLALPVAQSLSTELAVVGVRVTDAPATATATEDNTAFRNNKMYVIETTAVPPEIGEGSDYQTAQQLVAQFKQRNALLRAALEYPNPPPHPITPHLSPSTTVR